VHGFLIGRSSWIVQVLVAGCILTLLFLATIFPAVTNPARNYGGAITDNSASSLRNSSLQTSTFAPNATISVHPNATIDLSRTLKQIMVEIALNNTPDVPPFNGVQIELQYSTQVLTASSLDYSTNVFSQTGFPTDIVRNCLDGHGAGGNSGLCGSDDGPGITSFAETILGGSTPNGTQGNIFFLTFNVNTTAPSFSQIKIAIGILSIGITRIPTTNVDGYYSSLSCGGSPCSPAQANFVWFPKPPFAGRVVTFYGNSSLPSSGATITDYFWTFGDTASLRPYQDSGTNSTVSYIYQTAGSYSATLTITDSNGFKASKTQLVLVAAPQSGDFGIQLNPSFLTIHKSTFNDPFAFNSSTVILTSGGGLSGEISLQAFSFSNLGLALTPSTILISPGSTATSSLTVSAVNAAPGTYFVNVTGTHQFFNGTLTVLHHSAELTVQITGPPPDFEISIFTEFGSNFVFAGSDTTVGVQLEGLQSFSGTVSLTGQVLPFVNNGPSLAFNPSSVDLAFGLATSLLTVSTTTLTPPGNYTISVIGTSGLLVHTAQFVLTVLPLPVLAVNPSNGPVGTMVTVHGSGFITANQGPFSFPIELQMTFDDQLVGLFFIQGSSFNFTFNVPVSQAGIVHQIHAKELFPSSLDVQTSFTVTAEPSALRISVSIGAIYFQGDTATIFVSTSLDGQAISVSSLQIILVRPDGSNMTLASVQISAGYYKATYLVPSSGAFGTYAVIITAHQIGGGAQSALTNFEVKPTWLQSNAHTITTTTSIAGVVGAFGIIALAWKKGFVARKRESFPDF
jgi:hypothetical protein